MSTLGWLQSKRSPRAFSSFRLVLLGVAFVAAAIVGCGGGGGPGSRLVLPLPSALPVSRSSHVVIVVMENKDFGEVIGHEDAPYANRLAARYALATASYGVRHPSLPNYLALTAGSTFGIDSDCTDCAVNATNLVDQLERAGVRWKAYMEGMPSPCFLGASAGGYAKKHDPFLYYRDVATNVLRCARVVPFGQLGLDLRGGRLPTFVWITPNLCDDTHDCGVHDGDRFLASLVPALLRELGPHGFLVVTWDEGKQEGKQGCCRLASGGRIPTIVAGPDVRRGVRVTTPIDHYSVLRTVEDALGLPALRHARCSCTSTLARAFIHAPRIRHGAR